MKRGEEKDESELHLGLSGLVCLFVTWGSFSGLPLSIDDASNNGWTAIDSACGTYGIRYQYGNDTQLALSYDSAGNLAGAVVGVVNQPPSQQTPPWEQQSDSLWTIAFYFQDPTQICYQTQKKAVGAELGDRLTVRNGNTGSYIDIPLLESDIDSGWTLSPCFVSMGTHYWYSPTEDMDCNYFVPYAPMYEGGKLVTFLVASISDEPSSRWEQPNSFAMSLFFNSGQYPTCLKNVPKVSTMHFFMTNPIWNNCLFAKEALQMPM